MNKCCKSKKVSIYHLLQPSKKNQDTKYGPLWHFIGHKTETSLSSISIITLNVNMSVCLASDRVFHLMLSLQSEQDENMIEMAGDDVDVPEELLKMVDEDATEEEGKDSIMGQFQNLQSMDMDQLKEKASATVTELKSKAEEKCSVM